MFSGHNSFTMTISLLVFAELRQVLSRRLQLALLAVLGVLILLQALASLLQRVYFGESELTGRHYTSDIVMGWSLCYVAFPCLYQKFKPMIRIPKDLHLFDSEDEYTIVI